MPWDKTLEKVKRIDELWWCLETDDKYDLDNMVAESELLTGGPKNDSRFNEIDKLPWAADVTPIGIIFDY